jgi:hypothetical protein
MNIPQPNQDFPQRRNGLPTEQEQLLMQAMQQEIKANPDLGREATVVIDPSKPTIFDQPTVVDTSREPKKFDEQTTVVYIPDADLLAAATNHKFEEQPTAVRAPEPALLAAENVTKETAQTHQHITSVLAGTRPETAFARPVLAESELLPSETDDLEKFMEKEFLEANDAYDLYRFISRYSDNEKLWGFIERITRSRTDLEIFRANYQEWLSPQFIQSVLVTGGLHEEEYDPDTDTYRLVHIYTGYKKESRYETPAQKKEREELEKTGKRKSAASVFSTINSVLFTVEPEMKLQEKLAKSSLATLLARDSFNHETRMAQKCRQVIRRNSGHPGSKNIFLPDYIGSRVIVMNELKNSSGIAKSAREMMSDDFNSTPDWCRTMAGAVRGLDLMSKNGLINIDFKPGNVMDTPDGGVIIDWGGILENAALGRGEITVKKNKTSGGLYPLLGNETLETRTQEDWEKNYGNLPRTWAYSNQHLLAQELLGQTAPGTLHKYMLYRTLELYFIVREKSQRDPDQFIRMDEMKKLSYGPLDDVDESKLTLSEQLLFDLYLKLQQSHLHPYPDLNNDPEQGADPDYISLEEVAVALDQIAQIKD